MSTIHPSTACCKCNGTMEFGLIVDTRNYAPATALFRGSEKVLEWVRGTPRKSWWDLSFKADAADRLQIATLRCTKCGYVELYAPQASEGEAAS